MKKFLIAVFALLISIELSAQDVTSNQHDNYKYNHFYIDLVSKAAQINGDWGLFGGLRAGYNVTENFSLGLIGHGLIPDKMGSSYINQDGRDILNLGYGGAEAAYKYNLSDKFFLTGMIMMGVGRVDYESLGGHDYFFIMEPGASINYKLTDWFALGYSINYQLADGVNYGDLTNASLSGWAMDLSFKFGF